MTADAASAVQQLFVRHQAKVRSLALALTSDFSIAEDIVQETFLTASAKANDFRPDTNFVSWVLTIARLKILERRRSDRRLSRQVIESLAASMAPADFDDDRLGPLHQCIDELPTKSRELIRLRYFSQHGPGEIAALLGRSAVGVNAALVKIRAALRECVHKKMTEQG
jgi:RNA polymerase sigma-70 factor (ECF subfamily)